MSYQDAHKTKFHALLQEQIYSEFTNAQQYIAMAVYFDGADLRQLAKHFYAQAVEERNHAMMLVQYLLDRDVRVEIPGVDGVRNQFDTPRHALALVAGSGASGHRTGQQAGGRPAGTASGSRRPTITPA